MLANVVVILKHSAALGYHRDLVMFSQPFSLGHIGVNA